MAKKTDYYKGRRKKRNFAIIPIVVLMLLIAVAIVIFYAMQKYAVISDTGVRIDLPILTGNTTSSTSVSSGSVSNAAAKEYEVVNANIVFDDADYSTIEPTAGKKVQPVKAIFIPYEDLGEESVMAYAARLSTGNALVLDLKEKSGYMAWYSESETATKYGLNMAAPDSKESLKRVVSTLKEDGVYLVAQICCCQDELLGGHSTQVCIKNQLQMYYFDENGYWLDPYSTIVRQYTIELVRELWDIGFDEVLLACVKHPVVEKVEDENGNMVRPVEYTMDMSTTPSPVGGVCGFAVNVAETLADYKEDGKFLSIYLDSPTALVKADTENGQNGPLFMKLYDRIYYKTDKYAYTYNVQDMSPSVKIGSVYNRLVPVVENYLPDNSSWVLIDVEEG